MEASGSTIHNIVVVRPTAIAAPQTGLAALHVATPCRTVRQAHVDSKLETWIELGKPVPAIVVAPQQERRTVVATEREIAAEPLPEQWTAAATVGVIVLAIAAVVVVIASEIAVRPPAAAREETAHLVEAEVDSVAALRAPAALVAPPASAEAGVADDVAAVVAAGVVKSKRKRSEQKGSHMTRRILLTIALICACASLTVAASNSDSANKTTAQKGFATPQAALDELVKATSDYDVPTLLQIFGPDGEDFISSADQVQDKNNAQKFAELARQKSSVKTKSSKATIIVGENDWPFPIPLAKKSGKWYFDSKAGRNEVLMRRIGANELDAIQVCRGYVEAQHEYASTKHDGSEINQYAQKIISTPGKQDGLYWQNADGTAGGPVSEAVAKAIEEGYSVDKKSAYHGYYFKILKGQGASAPLGRLDYVIQDAMIGGFALIAAPAEYRVTGVKTFIVSQDGVVYQKDLGPDTLEIAKKIELFDPDKSWEPTFDQWSNGDDSDVAAK
jgi:hypothetical protein